MPRSQFARPVLDEPARRAIEEVDHAERHPQSPAPAQRTLQVGAADDRAEVEADAVADRVLSRLAIPHQHGAECGHGDAVRRTPGAAGGATIGTAGGALDTDSAGAIESARGGGSALPTEVRREMEAGFGHSLSDVRIHTDDQAAGLSRQMSARAFTTGRDIFFGAGEFTPDTTEGKRVLAHEIAHTRQNDGVRRKLRGTAEALRSQGDEKGDKGKSSGLLRKATGKLTNWDKIVGAVKAYEHQESKLIGGGKNPDPMALMSAKPGMLKQLSKVQNYIAEWRKANRGDEEDAAFEQSRVKSDKRGRQFTEAQQADSRSKTARRQAVALLEPRVGNEVQLLSSQDSAAWLGSLGLSAAQGAETGRKFGGQMNTVTEVAYQTESGDLTGFFKEDKGFNADIVDHESTVGIKQIDPNYGARSVALYRLDQLFDAGVTARAEFAVHKGAGGKSALGTVLESAKGSAAGDMTYGLDKKHAKNLRSQGGETKGAVALDDPVLQRGMNKLQLLDAIAGQLDRHMGNFYVDSDDNGNVTGVTGIDLDMAFGSEMTGVDTSHADGAFNYKGLPEFIDEEMGLKILQIQPGDLRAALTGLLPKGEVEATVARFREVQTAVMDAQKDGKLRGKWGGSVTQEGSSYKQLGDKWHERGSYMDEAKVGPQVLLNKEIGTAATSAIEAAVLKRDWKDLPDQVPPGLVHGFGYYKEGALEGPIKELGEVFWNAAATDRVRPVVNALVAEAMERTTVNRVWVDIQEGRPSDEPQVSARLALEKRAATLIAARLPQIRANLAMRASAMNRPRG